MKLKYTALAILMALPSTSYADIAFNGFTTMMGGMTLDDDDTLDGYDNDFDLKTGSLFGLQGRANMDGGLSATVQIIGKGQNDFDPEIEWAYISYELTNELTASVGKLRIPFYKYSEFLDVSYAYNWVRTPRSVYSLPFSTYEGLRLDHQTTFADIDSNLQLVAGNYNDTINGVGETEISDTLGLSWELNYDWLSVRAAYFTGKATIDLESGGDKSSSVFNGLKAFNAALTSQPALHNSINTAINNAEYSNDKSTFYGFGFSITPNNWNIIGEYTQVKLGDNFVSDPSNYYISVAYQFDNITPYIMYERSENEAKVNDIAPLNLAAVLAMIPDEQLVSPGSAAPASAIRMGINQAILGSGLLYDNQRDQEFDHYSLGLRWDFHSSAAFKIELHQKESNLGDNSKEELLSTSIDVVF